MKKPTSLYIFLSLNKNKLEHVALMFKKILGSYPKTITEITVMSVLLGYIHNDKSTQAWVPRVHILTLLFTSCVNLSYLPKPL